MTILDPVSVANLTVYLVQLPRSRTASRKQSTATPPIEFICLEQARAAGEVVISETGATERVRLENHSKQDLFIQAGEILRGGDQDRAVAGDLIIPAPRHEPETPDQGSWISTSYLIGEIIISETGITERVRLENHSKRDLFLQAVTASMASVRGSPSSRRK